MSLFLCNFFEDETLFIKTICYFDARLAHTTICPTLPTTYPQ